MSRLMILVSAIAVLSAAVFGQAFAGGHESPEETAIKARQGYMKLVGWSSGPIWGMLKGEVEYSADKAKQIAAELKALSQYPFAPFFVKGTSKSEQSGKTRALGKIWEDMDGFAKARADWVEAAQALEGAASDKGAFMAAAGKYGGTCDGCHKPYRAKDF